MRKLGAVMFSRAALGAPDMPMKTRDLHGEAELVSSIGLSSRSLKHSCLQSNETYSWNGGK